MKKLVSAAALLGMFIIAPQAKAAFHLWAIQEIYSNSSGTVQFIEFYDGFGGQEFTAFQDVSVTNLANTQTNTYTLTHHLPSNANPQDSFGHTFLLGTAGLQAAGGPAPDFVVPDGFLFTGGGSIDFFGLNGGSYPALPTNGSLSLNWDFGTTGTNSPKNFAGQTGVVPEPAALVLAGCAGGFGLYAMMRRGSLNKSVNA